MKVEVMVDVLWPTRVRITRGGVEVWVPHDDARVLRDQLTSLLRPVPKETLLAIAKVTEGRI